MDVDNKLYGRPMSTIFGSGEKQFIFDDEHDPIVNELRMLNYRYVRFFFHQQKDKFVLFGGWKDPNWTDIRSARSGLDSDEKSLREVVFGKNDIDIEQKSISRLLVDEVSSPRYPHSGSCETDQVRLFIHSTFSKLRVSSCGL